MHNDSQYERGSISKGNTSMIRPDARRTSTDMISATTHQSKVRLKIFNGTMNAKILIYLYRCQTKLAGRKFDIVLDYLHVRHEKVFKNWLGDRGCGIDVIYLPSYFPDLNADEYLKSDLNGSVHRDRPAETSKQLQRKAISHIRILQQQTQRVAKYFKHENVCYVA